MGEYRFINTTGSDGVIAQADSAARGYAIRAGIRHGWATTGTANNQSRATTGRKKELKGRFRLMQTPPTALDGALQPVGESETASRRARRPKRTMTRPTIPLSGNGIEPFNSLPIPQNRQVNELTQYFLSSFRMNGSEAGTKKVWFSYATQYDVVMHSTIALSAACLTANKRSDKLLWQEGLRQKGEAMRLIGEWLLQTNLAYDDTRCASIMTSISTLSSTEVMYGNFEAAKAHLLGVHSLFYRLDGTERFTKETVLCKAINTADLLLATAIDRPPLFPLLDLEDNHLSDSIYEQHALEQPLHKVVVTTCGDDISRVFSTLRLAIRAKRSGSVSPHSIRILLNLAEYELLGKLQNSSFKRASASDGSVISAIALAAHLFLYVVLREMPTNNLLIRTMSSRIQKVIKKVTETQRTSPEHGPALEWVACVGILGTWTGGSEVSAEKMYFATLLKNSRRHLNSTVHDTVVELSQRLSQFLWDAEYCDQTMREAVEWGRTYRAPSPS